MSTPSKYSVTAVEAAGMAEAGKKRARYTSVACNECKRRKIKCNGEKPCERCGHQGLDCVYVTHDFQETDEFRRMTGRIDSLEQQVDDLVSIVTQMRRELDNLKTAGASPDLHTSLGLAMAARAAESRSQGAATMKESPGTAANIGLSMDVDMSREGRIDFVQHTEHPYANHSDPILSVDRRDIVRLFSFYTSHIHPIFPFIRTQDVMWQLHKIMNFREAASHGGPVPAGLPNPDHLRLDPVVTTIKMMLAVAAKAEGLMQNPITSIFYNEVQQIYAERGYPPRQTEASSNEEPNVTHGRHASWIENCTCLRMLQAIWHFQHGEFEQTLTELTETRMAYEAELRSIHSDCPTVRTTETIPGLQLADTLYSMYWLFNTLLKPEPRLDLALDSAPPTHFPVDFAQDAENTLRGPLFEYAKTCSLVCFGFESPEESLPILESLDPSFSREEAVLFVHRWQTHFPDGLRSMSTRLPGNLSSLLPRERVVHALVYLLANYLRLVIYNYQVRAAGSTTVSPGSAVPDFTSLSDPFGSARYAEDSIQVLWNVHHTVTSWHVHCHMYNHFLLQASEWLYSLLKSCAIPLDDEVKTALERALVMLETYTPEWVMASKLLQKLRNSRKHGVLGDPLM